LEEIVDKTLEKDRELRCQSAAELRGDLKRLKRDNDSGKVAPVSGKSLPPLGAVSSSKPRWIMASIALATLAAGFLLGRVTAKPAPLSLPVYQQVTFRHGGIRMARFAPDGKTMIYSAAWEDRPMEIYTTRTESPESRSMGLEGAEILAVSPQGGEMAVLLHSHNIEPFISSGTLARVPLQGGAPREVLEGVQWADWSPSSDNFLVVRDLEGQNRLEFPSGKVLYQTAGWISNPRFSPNEKYIAFIDHPQRRDDAGVIAVIDMNGVKKTLSEGWESAQGLAWSPSGEEVWFSSAYISSDRFLNAVTLKGTRRLLAREPGTLTLQDVSATAACLSPATWSVSAWWVFPRAEPKNPTSLGWIGPLLRTFPRTVRRCSSPSRAREAVNTTVPTPEPRMAPLPFASAAARLMLFLQTRNGSSLASPASRLTASSCPPALVKTADSATTASRWSGHTGCPTASVTSSLAMKKIGACAYGCRASTALSPRQLLPKAFAPRSG
jgi:eukaryotic-like serine/threonine-protein kinase